MGFPYDEAAWSVVDGAMFMGWGTAMPGVYTAIAAAVCAYVQAISLNINNLIRKNKLKNIDIKGLQLCSPFFIYCLIGIFF